MGQIDFDAALEHEYPWHFCSTCTNAIKQEVADKTGANLFQARHVRLFPDDGAVVIAILNAKTGRGFQQSLSLHEPDLVRVLHFLWLRIKPEGLMFRSGAPAFREAFAALVRAVGLEPAAFLPYSLRREGATEFYQSTQSLGRTTT